MNKFEIEGNLTRDVSLMEGKKASVALFTVAVNREGAGGVDFISVKALKSLAESAAATLKQGSHVKVTGYISSGSVENKDGTKRYFQDLVATDIKYIAGGSNGDNGGVVVVTKPQAPQTVQAVPQVQGVQTVPQQTVMQAAPQVYTANQYLQQTTNR